MISIIIYAAFHSKIGDTTHMTETHSAHSHTILSNTTTLLQQQHSITVTHVPFTSISTGPERIDYSIVTLEIVNLCLLALSLCATMWSLIKIRKLNYRRATTGEK
jgi:hypothetical protein